MDLITLFLIINILGNIGGIAISYMLFRAVGPTEPEAGRETDHQPEPAKLQ